MSNAFYFGDNLHILREYIPDESVDLIYLDPPFNSNANYNLLFKSPDKTRWADAQIATFDDTWTWGDVAEETFNDTTAMPGRVADVMHSLRLILGTNDMLAYLTMMTARLVEMHRVLKSTGSLYLHCDSTASHYLKIVLDAVFGPPNYRNEIIWRRTNAHNVKTRNFPRVHDTLLFFSKSAENKWTKTYQEYSAAQLGRYKKDANGRLFTGQDLTMAGGSAERKAEWRGTKPPSHRAWGASLEQREQWWAEGRILTKKDGTPRLDGRLVYLDEKPGKASDSIWTDIQRIGNTAAERLGYPTQKPIALLKRIIEASSDEDDVILDPFCGCGTALHAAHEMGRAWIGVDVAIQSMHVVQDRLKHHFPSIKYDVFGIPKSADAAMWLAENHPFKFEEWAVTALGAMHSGKFRNDGGIDGSFYYLTSNEDRSRGIVSVKGGQNLNPGMVRDLGGTLETQRRLTKDPQAVGVLICAHEPTQGMRDAARSFGKVETMFGDIPAVQIITIAEMFDGRTIDVPLMLDTVTAAALGRKAKTIDAFRKPIDMSQREMMLPISGGKAAAALADVREDAPVMPSFRERRAAS